jgi:hypothetical protein
MEYKIISYFINRFNAIFRDILSLNYCKISRRFYCYFWINILKMSNKYSKTHSNAVTNLNKANQVKKVIIGLFFEK